MPEEQGQERTEDATPRRKEEARKRGTVAKSVDVTGALTLLAAGALAPMLVSGVGGSIWGGMHRLWTRPPTTLDAQSAGAAFWAMAMPSMIAGFPLLLCLTGVGVASQFAQVGFTLSAEPMKPTFDKINLFQGFKRVFSIRMLVEGAKALAKMTLFGWLAYSAISADWGKLVTLSSLTPPHAAELVAGILQSILMRVGFVWLIIAGFDYFFQRKNVAKQLKMTKQDLKQEMKDQEGSPEVKGAMARKRQKLLKGGLAKKIRESDVIVTNPTHFAVALKYDRSSMHAPMVIAKGQDYLALKMREIAEAEGVPRVENRALARALYKQCEAGDYVPRDLFNPVAEVLAFVFRTAKKTRQAA